MKLMNKVFGIGALLSTLNCGEVDRLNKVEEPTPEVMETVPKVTRPAVEPVKDQSCVPEEMYGNIDPSCNIEDCDNVYTIDNFWVPQTYLINGKEFEIYFKGVANIYGNNCMPYIKYARILVNGEEIGSFDESFGLGDSTKVLFEGECADLGNNVTFLLTQANAFKIGGTVEGSIEYCFPGN